jgi:hypothetical protein
VTIFALAAVLALPPAPGDAVLTLDLAKLDALKARSLDGHPIRVSFVIDSLPEERGDAVAVEAAGPEHESRIVELSKGGGGDLLTLAPGDRLVAEGVLRVVRHRASGEFVGFVEVRVTGARVVRNKGSRWAGAVRAGRPSA